MSTFSIDPSNEDNKQNDNAYYNQFRAIQPTGITPENRPNIRYNKSLFDQNKDYSTYNTNITENNNARSITTDWTAQSIRNFKYNILLDRFSPGYPLNYTYNLCDQKLSSVFSIGSYTHYSVDQSVSTNYPKNHSTSIIQNNTNNPFLCSVPPTGNCQNTVCAPGQIFDPLTCLCTTPEECVPQDGCEPEVVYTNIKPKISGYAFYLDSVQEVNIPDIGNVKASCGGGHACCGTLFRPTLVFSNNSKLEANRNVCMDNVGPRICPNDGSQMPVPGFVGGQYERSDMFEFVLDNPSSLVDARLELVCQYRGCHSGVTFVVLVGETVDTNEKVILFSSCVAPGSVNSKVIGTIDCDNEPVPCEPPPTPTSPTPTPTPVPPTPSSTPPVTPTPTVTPSVCQDVCVQASFFTQDTTTGRPPYEGNQCEAPYILGTSTINVPPGLTLPLYVTMTGSADDLLVIDGQIVNAGQYQLGTSPCWVGAGNYSFVLNSSSFTIAAADTAGGNAGYTYDICFSKCPPPLCYQASCYGCGDIDCCNADPGSCPPQCNGLCGVDCEYSNQPCLIQSFATLQEASDYMDATCYGLNGTVINTCNG